MISISALQGTPVQIFEDIEAFSNQKEIEYQFELRDPQPMAAIQELLPAAIMIYLSKPFFDAFLSKAGEDSYQAFKKILCRTIESCRKLTVETLTSGKFKIRSKSKHSQTVSLYVPLKDGRRSKILFPLTLADEELEGSLESLLSGLAAYYTDNKNDPLTKELEVRTTHAMTVLAYDTSKREWNSLTLEDIALKKGSNKSE